MCVYVVLLTRLKCFLRVVLVKLTNWAPTVCVFHFAFQDVLIWISTEFKLKVIWRHATAERVDNSIYFCFLYSIISVACEPPPKKNNTHECVSRRGRFCMCLSKKCYTFLSGSDGQTTFLSYGLRKYVSREAKGKICRFVKGKQNVIHNIYSCKDVEVI